MRIHRRTVPALAASVAALVALTLTACDSDTSGDAVATSSSDIVLPSTAPAATTRTSPAVPALPYSPAEDHVVGSTERATYDVVIPQVTGGDAAVAGEFNESMHAALQELIDGHIPGATGPGTATSGPGQGRFTLESSQHEVVHIGGRVLSGLLVVSWTADPPGAHSTPLVSTVVVDTDTAQPITLADLFPDLTAGLQALSDESAKLLPATAAGENFERAGIEPTADNFANWLATPEGMVVQFGDYQVGPHAIGLIDITIPWSDLEPVLDPAVLPVVSS
ncbi:RsiV family protein [Rhodococcus sp. HNM0569]|uniref:RsiV family protein n=1 Tax=Rhodococcus sp. HNM0569 TaxID=2716340 RepID=UPI00146BC571|nr:RsiV family protein [Rhodococcus sp. HNM0569]NLU84342.1 DUF3298 domain-containing protein [Rhodococcus sp. HNM0569]